MAPRTVFRPVLPRCSVTVLYAHDRHLLALVSDRIRLDWQPLGFFGADLEHVFAKSMICPIRVGEKHITPERPQMCLRSTLYKHVRVQL